MQQAAVKRVDDEGRVEVCVSHPTGGFTRPSAAPAHQGVFGGLLRSTCQLRRLLDGEIGASCRSRNSHACAGGWQAGLPQRPNTILRLPFPPSAWGCPSHFPLLLPAVISTDARELPRYAEKDCRVGSPLLSTSHSSVCPVCVHGPAPNCHLPFAVLGRRAAKATQYKYRLVGHCRVLTKTRSSLQRLVREKSWEEWIESVITPL